jgi:hypothetical protein
MGRRMVVRLLILAALAALAKADYAAIRAFNDEAQLAVRTFGIQSQIASRVSEEVLAPAVNRWRACCRGPFNQAPGHGLAM